MKKGLSCTTHPLNPSFHLIFGGGCSTRKHHFLYYPPERNPIPSFATPSLDPNTSTATKNLATARATYISSPFTNPSQGPNNSRQQEVRHPSSIIRNNQGLNTSRHKAGGAAPGLSCAACFEQLAGVLASCDAFPPVPSHPTPTNCIRRQNTLTTNGKTTTQLCSTCKILSPDDPGNCMLLLIRESVYG